MKLLLENSRYVLIVVVVLLLILMGAALVWGAARTAETVVSMVTETQTTSKVIGKLIELLDIYLIIAALYIFCVSIYELFIGDLKLPQWLIIHSFDELKATLSNVVVLVMAVSFLKLFLEGGSAADTLLYGVAFAVVSFALIAYRQHPHPPAANTPHADESQANTPHK